jgi:ribonuclease BN (tRNA processing enzyme)
MSDVTFVGTSDAFGAGGRRQSAILVRAPQGAVLLDCGATTNSGLQQLQIDRDEIDAIAVSHFHGDHFGGIPPFLLAAQFIDERSRPLTIAGPRGIEARVEALARAMGHPLAVPIPFEVQFRELPTDREMEVGPVRIRAFETHHSPDSCPHGLLLQSGARRIAYSGDTGWFDGLPAEISGSDLFICECTLCEPVYEFHLDLETLLAQRARFDCGRLILTHLGSEMNARRGALEIETADDGVELSL